MASPECEAAKAQNRELSEQAAKKINSNVLLGCLAGAAIGGAVTRSRLGAIFGCAAGAGGSALVGVVAPEWVGLPSKREYRSKQEGVVASCHVPANELSPEQRAKVIRTLMFEDRVPIVREDGERIPKGTFAAGNCEITRESGTSEPPVYRIKIYGETFRSDSRRPQTPMQEFRFLSKSNEAIAVNGTSLQALDRALGYAYAFQKGTLPE